MLCIITARGGSKRIPRKNIKDFLGKPIIAYAINAALESKLFSEVMVSTDDDEIAAVAQKYGAKVPFMRSAKTSDDFATTDDVLREVLGVYRAQGREFESFACIYPTAVLLSAERLIGAYELFCKKNASLLVPVVKFAFPPQRAFVLKDGYLSYKEPLNAPKRSQDLEALYHDAGAFYFYKTADFLASKTEGRVAMILSEIEVQDIDNIDDWRMAELKYKVLNECSNKS